MIAELVKFFINPFNIFWILLLCSLFALILKRNTLFNWLIAGCIGWFVLVSTPLVPAILINSLEDQHNPVFVEELDDPDAEYHIIVLGSGHGIDDRLPANSLLSANALGRLNEGIRLHRQLPNSRLVLSGFSSSGRTSQAEMLRKTAVLLGVNEESTLIQTEPGNTCEEARVYAENFGTQYPVILVTSATHMPRAMVLFESQGIHPMASPTNYRLRGSWKKKRIGLPAVNNINNTQSALYEYAGRLSAKFC